MNFLLDTSILINATNAPYKIKNEIKNIMENENNIFIISIISLWEISIKQSISKLKLSLSIEEMTQKLLENGIIILPIKISHVICVKNLPFHHKDPFDRMLIAQAICEDFTILTSDKEFEKYQVNMITN